MVSADEGGLVQCPIVTRSKRTVGTLPSDVKPKNRAPLHRSSPALHSAFIIMRHISLGIPGYRRRHSMPESH